MLADPAFRPRRATARPPAPRPSCWAPALLAALTLLLLLLPATGRAGERMSADALETALDAVLVVRGAGPAEAFLGSAFLWGDGAVAVTAAHVVGRAETVELTDRHGRTLPARVIARDPVRDLAVLEAAGFARPGLHPGTPGQLGQTVWALGAPMGAAFTLTRGMVSAQARQVAAAVPLKLLQHDAPVNPGSSGGPLMDHAGRVLGMNTRIADGAPFFVGLGYAVAVPDLERIVAGLCSGALKPMPSLGLHLRPVDRQIAAALGRAPGGLLVDRVLPGEAAARAGLRPGDIIETAGGASLRESGDLAFAVEAALARGALVLALWRDGAPARAVLILDASDAPDLIARTTLATLAPPRGARDLGALGLVLDPQGRAARVVEGSPAHLAGLTPGDRIEAVNGAAAAPDGLAALTIEAPALLRIGRGLGDTLHVLLDPYPAPGRARRIGAGANSLDPAVAVF